MDDKSDIKNQISKRINRIVGQLYGIGKMVEQKRDCNDILQQISAIKKAIDGLSKEIVVSDFCRLLPKTKSKQVEQMVERVINL
jgi:DNA-binding FrmR family transcriptional regulator